MVAAHAGVAAGPQARIGHRPALLFSATGDSTGIGVERDQFLDDLPFIGFLGSPQNAAFPVPGTPRRRPIPGVLRVPEQEVAHAAGIR